MGLFEKLKNAVTSSKNSTPITYQQSKKLSYVPSYHIEDWQPKLKYPEYDRLFSLQKYLENIEVPKTVISKVMKSDNPFGEAKKSV